MAPERRLFDISSPGGNGELLFAEQDFIEYERSNGQQTNDYVPEGSMGNGVEDRSLSDVHMASRRAEEAANRRFEGAQWLQEMLGSLGISNEPTEEELRLALRNGLVLCNLLNKIHPGAIPKIVENPTPPSPPEGALSAYQYFENVRNFLVAVEDMKLPSFEASDLAQGSLQVGSMSKVVDCILALKSYFNWREGKGLSPWRYSGSKLGTKSPCKGTTMLMEDAYRMEELVVTPKSSHTRKRWAIPGADFTESAEMSMSYEFNSPNCQREMSPAGHRGNGICDASLDSENFASPDSTAARLHQIGQKFREVLQVKRTQDVQTSELSGAVNGFDANSNLKGAPVQSLPSLVKSIISDKQPEEVPVLVEFMMRKVMEEFERRLRTQGEQVRKLKTSLRDLMARESKLSSRAKVLEALAAGSGEEIKLVTQQLQQIKMEKKRLEDEKKTNEGDMGKLSRDRDEKQMTIEMLRKEILLMKQEQQQKHETELQNQKLVMDYEIKIREMEGSLEESTIRIQALEVTAAAECNNFKKREENYKRVISLQSKALEDLKLISQSVRTGAMDMQMCWQQELLKLENELGGLTSAAQAYHDVLVENRRLYNEVQDLKGNIRVYCRIRPSLGGQRDQRSTVDFVGDNGEIMIMNPTKHGKDACKMFNFNKIYGPEASQEDVFLDAQPLIRSVLDGFNVCIFAYGQTGSGKTYTMSGPKEDWGVNYRALYDLFQICQSRRDAFAYEVGVQMIEIYNEQVRDLLAGDGVSKRLGIRTSSSLNGVNVPDAIMIPVGSTADVLEIMAIGQRNRAVGATALNERSSRSHSVLTVHVQGTDLAKGCILRGSLHLVDLAGSERVEKSEATGDRLKEAQHINKSLSALGDVISALAQKSAHIPYRNSKLTQLLQDSLGGQAKTLMFVHVNSDSESYGETISTLKFAERVSAVELGAARTNRESSEIREFKEQVVALKDMLARKDAEIERLQSAKVFRSSISEMEKQKPKVVLQSNRLSIDNRGRKPIEMVSNEGRLTSAGSVQFRASSRDPSPDEVERGLSVASSLVSEESLGRLRRPASRESGTTATQSEAASILQQDSSIDKMREADLGIANENSLDYAIPTSIVESHSEQSCDMIHGNCETSQVRGADPSPDDWLVPSEATERTHEEMVGELSEGDTSQDSFSVASEQSFHQAGRTSHLRASTSGLRSLAQTQIPRPPRSEKKHPPPSPSVGLRRLSDAAAVRAASFGDKEAMPNSSENPNKQLNARQTIFPNGTWQSKSSKRWL